MQNWKNFYSTKYFSNILFDVTKICGNSTNSIQTTEKILLILLHKIKEKVIIFSRIKFALISQIAHELKQNFMPFLPLFFRELTELIELNKYFTFSFISYYISIIIKSLSKHIIKDFSSLSITTREIRYNYRDYICKFGSEMIGFLLRMDVTSHNIVFTIISEISSNLTYKRASILAISMMEALIKNIYRPSFNLLKMLDNLLSELLSEISSKTINITLCKVKNIQEYDEFKSTTMMKQFHAISAVALIFNKLLLKNNQIMSVNQLFIALLTNFRKRTSKFCLERSKKKDFSLQGISIDISSY
jgi:hypothetical protein